ncbi:MAG: cobyric acid synthase [Acidobacteriota bacterium]|nr:cobyric acid synthase [Acidobacteriota bacterium]
MRARSMMVAGTASHVGKSWMATAICRWLARQGWSVAPFKAQNMSNNSYPCASGGEIGRAQVAQAQACFLEPEPDMNPILLKPNSDNGSQVVLHGKMWRTLPAREYYAQFPYLLGEVLEAYERLAARHDFIVIEGAGSITELNLKHTDLVNLGLATRLNAPVLLVADIDRGGVFASIAGTFALLEESERALVRAFAINRFRGDAALFDTGVEFLEKRTGRPCLGVFPYLAGAPLDAEDGVSIEGRGITDSDIAIIAFPHIANLSDFRLIPDARRITRPLDGTFACVILPGTKNTLADLAWLRNVGLDAWVIEQHRRGAHIIGVCGGYQMMGERIEDPLALESDIGAAEGLRLLPVSTVLAGEKNTRAVHAVTPSGLRFAAYDIHLGRTTRPESAPPFAVLSDGTVDGLRAERCTGTYLHGALEDSLVLGELLRRDIKEIPNRDQVYDALADWFEANVDRRRFEETYLCG